MTKTFENNLIKILLMLIIVISILSFTNFSEAVGLSPKMPTNEGERTDNRGIQFTPGVDVKWTLNNTFRYYFTVSDPGFYTLVPPAITNYNSVIIYEENGNEADSDGYGMGTYDLDENKRYYFEIEEYFSISEGEKITEGEYAGCYKHLIERFPNNTYMFLDESGNLKGFELIDSSKENEYVTMPLYQYEINPENPPDTSPDIPPDTPPDTPPQTYDTTKVVVLNSNSDSHSSKHEFLADSKEWYYTNDLTNITQTVNGKTGYLFKVIASGKYEIKVTDKAEGNPKDPIKIINISGKGIPKVDSGELKLDAQATYFIECGKYTRITYVCELRDGSLDLPYIIYDGLELAYKEIPFYFCVETDAPADASGKKSLEGTYEIFWDKERKVVIFTYIDSGKVSGYHKIDDSTEPYVQAGVTVIALANKIEDKPMYAVKEEDIWTSNIEKELYLNNAVRGGANIANVTIENVQYVFVNRYKNKGEAYGSSEPNPGDVIQIIYCFEGMTKDIEEESATGVESVISTILNAIGDLYAMMFRSKDGRNCTIDIIIFNDYEPTTIDFFGNGGTVSSAFKRTVNYWFDAFVKLTYLIYMIMLLYIGIQISLTAGSDKKKKYKEYIESWVVGLLILMVVPLIIKYTFKINNILVSMVGKQRTTVYTMINSGREFDDEGNVGEDNKTVIVVEELEKAIDDKRNEYNKEMDELRKENTVDIANYLSRCVPELVASANVNEAKNIVYNYNNSLIAAIRQNGEDAEWSESDESDFNARVNSFYDYIMAHPKEGLSFSSRTEIDAYCQSNIVGKEFKVTYMEYGNTYTETVVYKGDASFSKIIREYKEARISAYERIKELEELQEQYNAYTSGTDLMGDMRARAGKTRRVLYSVIYLILLFQLTFLLILYYKRIFIVGILIIIFPLVMAVYVKDKSRRWQSTSVNNMGKRIHGECAYTICTCSHICCNSRDRTKDLFR